MCTGWPVSYGCADLARAKLAELSGAMAESLACPAPLLASAVYSEKPLDMEVGEGLKNRLKEGKFVCFLP